MKLISTSLFLAAASLLVHGSFADEGNIRGRELEYVDKQVTVRYSYKVVTTAVDLTWSRVAWRLFRDQSDPTGAVSDRDSIMNVDAKTYRDDSFPVSLSAGRYCIRAYKGRGTEFGDKFSYWTDVANEISLIRYREEKEFCLSCMFSSFTRWTRLGADVIGSVSVEDYGLEYDCFDVDESSGLEQKESKQVWDSDGSCEDTEFYFASSRITDSTEAAGLFKLVYGPAASKSSYSAQRSFVAAAKMIPNLQATCVRDMALGFYCREKWYKSTSKMMQYVFWVADNHESLARIAQGELVDEIEGKINDEIKTNIKEKLGIDFPSIPSYQDVMDFWKNVITDAELKRLQVMVEVACK